MNMKKKAFTLIELMVVIAIVAIMTAAVLVIISPSQRAAQDVKAEGRKVASVIASMQNDALSGKNAGSSCSNTYTFNAANGAAAYTLSGCTSANYSTASGVKFQGAVNFNFTSPFGASSIGTSQAVTLTKSGKIYTVCVYKNGKIIEIADTTTCP